MTVNHTMLHPALRRYPDTWLEQRMSQHNAFFPPEERIAYYGDIQLYAREADYQSVLDTVAGAPLTGEGLNRRIVYPWDGLDEYRERVKAWAASVPPEPVPAPDIRHVELPAGDVYITTPVSKPTPMLGAAPAPLTPTGASPVTVYPPAKRSAWARFKGWLRRAFGS